MSKLSLKLPWQRSRSPHVEEDDGDVEAIIFASLWKNHRLLPPHSPKKRYWDVMMFTFVLYNSVYVPIDIAFTPDKNIPQCVIDVLIDLLFVVDILLNLRTTYYDAEGQLVLEARKIYKNYLCSYWFVIDFLAVFPFDIIATGGLDCGAKSDDAGTSFNAGAVKVLRLLRLMRFRKELDRLSGANALRVFVSLSFFILVAHWLACAWWMVGILEFQNDEHEASERNLTKICDNSRPCSWLRRVPPGQMPLSPDSSFGDQYITSFFWSLTTLMKTPWIGPDTIAEKITAIIAIFAGAVFYASFLGTVQGSYASYNKANAQKRDKITNLTAFMKHYAIPSDLQQKLLQHTNTQAATLPLGLVNSQVLMQLPSHLRGDVALELYTEACGTPASMFPNISIECAKALVTRLQTQMAMTNQILIAKDEVCKQLYFLVRGALRVTVDAPSDGGDSSPSVASDRPRASCTSTADSPGGVQRLSSRKGFGGMRELEKPGTSVGLIEPKEANAAGLYPVWVTSTKKTLLLYISQPSLAEVLSAFGGDLGPLRESLTKQHKQLLESLKVTPGPDSTVALAEAMLQRKKELAELDRIAHEQIVITEDDKTRIATLEETIEDITQQMSTMKEELALLPRILELVEKAAEEDESSSLLTPR